MAYKVQVTGRARKDAQDTVEYLRRASPQAAKKWLAEFKRIIAGLRRMPERFALIPEAQELGRPFRSVNLYSYRIVYRIEPDDKVVYVVRVYHGARRPLEDEDLEDLR